MVSVVSDYGNNAVSMCRSEDCRDDLCWEWDTFFASM